MRHDWATVKNQDTNFESLAEMIDRREVNWKILDSVTGLTGSTDVSFRGTANDARFRFVSE
jgi:hypothetical protein